MLKALMLRRRIDLKKKDLDALREKLAGFATRETELEQAIGEVETEEQRTAVEEEITAFETERGEAQESADQLEREISDLETELQQEEDAQDTTPPAETGANDEGGEARNHAGQETAENRGREINMIKRLKNYTQQERDAFLGNERITMQRAKEINGK